MSQTNDSVNTERISKEEVDSRRKQIEADTQLDDASKTKIRTIYEKVLQNLETIQSNQQARQRFEEQAAKANENLEQAKEKLRESGQQRQGLPIPSAASLAELEQELTRIDAALKEKTENLARLDSEPKRRASRLEQIPQQLADADKELTKVETQIIDAPDTPLGVAERTDALVRKELLQSTKLMLDKERAAYESTMELIQIERDLAAADFAFYDSEAKRWRTLVDARRNEEAKQQAADARRAALRAKPELADLAKEIERLANERQELAKSMNDLSVEHEAIRATLSTVATAYGRAKENAEAVGLSQSSGQILRKERETLPDLRAYRRDMKSRELLRRDARFKQYQHQDSRLAMADLEASVESFAKAIDDDDQETVDEIRELLTLKKESLDNLIREYEFYVGRLLKTNEIENDLIQETQAYSTFIRERVLWIRSAFPSSHRDLLPALDAFRWLLLTENWKAVGNAFIPKTTLQCLYYFLSTIVVAALFCSQWMIRKRIVEIGETVSRRGFSKFAPTVRAFLLTIVASSLWPAIMWCLSFFFSYSPSLFVRSLGNACLQIGAVWFPLECLRQTCRPNGLGQCHFQWSATVLPVIRKRVQRLMIVGIPFLLLASLLESQNRQELWHSSLGRAAFVVFLLLCSVTFYRILLSTGRVFEKLQISASLPKGGNKALAIGLTAAPCALAILAILGYYDTSQTLAAWLFQTICWLLLLLLVNELCSRWILMRRRRLAIELLRQRGESEAVTNDPAIASATCDDEVDLTTVSAQTVQLLRTLMFVAAGVGGWLIWGDVVPALSVVQIWPGVTSISLAQLLSLVVIAILTVVAVKNVPGLIELTLLNYLPVDAGARYAITTICRYAIAAAGAILIGNGLGISWESLPWLIATMGIGLGFGLQEIFANFISGVIVLFERPIRVGDTITLGETTGVVARIRMRATTVTDWDLKEFVIPNKDLVTGRLLNWTLSNQTSRIVIHVGVAYGSDTEQARSLLLKVAKEHPRILDDPIPSAIFEGFGDSTLNLTLRCYLPDLENRLPTISDLHTSIDEEFKRAGIEIAFPQRDIHLRTIPQTLESRIGGECINERR